jgi:putative ATP-dependent endonuclease of OLD family
MYLSKLKITNFRSIKSLELDFNKGVNILIGENNSGKTAVIDALRIGLGYGKSSNNIFINESDLHLNRNDINEYNDEIQFDFIFEMEEAKERECFFDFLSQDIENPLKQTIQIHIKFKYEKRGSRNFFKRTVWGGDNEGQNVPYDALEEIFFIYLDPLRDAVQSLKPYSYANKVGNLFNELTKYKKNGIDIPLNEEKKNELASDLYSVFEGNNSDWESILQTGNEKVNDHLDGTGISSKYPNIKMKYVGRKYSDVVRGIELKRPVYVPETENGQKYFEIRQNGLGENNLIYTSVVLGDLINRCEDENLQIYNALLVEEPEAHLHPQYQNTFFQYLNQLQSKGVQIFITSHSPTITAKSNFENITVLQVQDNKVSPFCFSRLSLEEFTIRNRNHLKKFLDTTKSKLFFANGVILVEGIAEAILIPVISKFFLNLDLDKLGIEIVNINGVAFEHFAKLFNNDDKNKSMSSRCSIITDSDPKGDKPISDRAVIAQGFENGNLKVCLAPNTLEYDLFNESEVNESVMRSVYRSLHLQTPDLLMDFNAETLMEKLKSNQDKGDFALDLANILKDFDGFEVPEYIEKAIHWVLKINDNV